MLKGKKILIGVTGSIAAYKIPYLIRLLVKEGAEVQVILTENARDFVTPLTISTLSKRPALTYPFNPDDGTWNNHVEMGGWADLMLIAPASAATLSKMAAGMADNLLVTTYLSAKCPVFFAPAMDLDMYKHPTTQRNIEQLKTFGHQLIEPQVGELASGLCGAGRMEEPENILKAITAFFLTGSQLLNKKVLVTAGPTYEPIDPVRFIGNHSSGLMGFSLAHDAAARGAEVTLVTGPTHLQCDHPSIKRVDVTTAGEMLEKTTAAFTDSDITIMSAAVADFTPAKPADKKIKKSGENQVIDLVPTQDILAFLGKIKRNDQLLVGFALETDNELENARKKLNTKHLDLIVLNSLKEKGAGFGVVTNKITMLDRSGNQIDFPLKPKAGVASDILDKVVEMLSKVIV
ncbi:MAG: bifunctional phosphopantothenoylcysteine decarboxylase/phosphopantothenate--cysteine ligase CoaBC [Bacteroidales bacterium]|nr:bifunctional phosphopantothenoylcysteine decarboxylase/phosphopantothenate--cysteine ligase CoaBC [Bacteroidales bacterium]